MPKNKLTDLRDHLFETLEMLKDGDIEVGRAEAITKVAQVIVNTAKVEVDYLNTIGGIGSEFLHRDPKELQEIREDRLLEESKKIN